MKPVARSLAGQMLIYLRGADWPRLDREQEAGKRICMKKKHMALFALLTWELQHASGRARLCCSMRRRIR